MELVKPPVIVETRISEGQWEDQVGRIVARVDAMVAGHVGEVDA